MCSLEMMLGFLVQKKHSGGRSLPPLDAVLGDPNAMGALGNDGTAQPLGSSLADDIPQMNLSLLGAWKIMENLNEDPHPLEELQYCMDLYPGLADLKSAEAISTKYHPGIQNRLQTPRKTAGKQRKLHRPILQTLLQSRLEDSFLKFKTMSQETLQAMDVSLIRTSF